MRVGPDNTIYSPTLHYLLSFNRRAPPSPPPEMFPPLFIATITAAILVSIVSIISFLYFMIRRSRKSPNDVERGSLNVRVADVPESPPSAGEQTVRKFSWPEIESLTAGFSPAALIGEGGFSTVYLTDPIQLTSKSSDLAAVKVHRGSERLHRVFLNELDVLLCLRRCQRHPNLVRLLGFSDYGDDGGALVFEHVPNGSLHTSIHGGRSAVMPWDRRMSVAYRLAGAVDFLHEGCDPQIVHGDIKAANVLMDGRMDPILCDFGSARMGFSAAVSRTGPTMVGSPGYMDPHYLRTGIISKKSDVYSFGVLLFELLTGSEAFCSETERPLTAALLREGRLTAEFAVDPKLGGDYDAAEAAAVAKVAEQCVGQQPALRPLMAEVVRMMRENVPSLISAVD